MAKTMNLNIILQLYLKDKILQVGTNMIYYSGPKINQLFKLLRV